MKRAKAKEITTEKEVEATTEKATEKDSATKDVHALHLFSAAALLCLMLSAALLWNQGTLNRGADALLSALRVTELPTVRWFEEESEPPQTEPPNADLPDASVENLTGQVSGGHTYVLNTSSKKIHSPTCRYAQSMDDSNKETVSDVSLAELEAQGYSVCSVCGAK